MSQWMSADEAAAALDVKKATIYAYASRGMLRSESAGGRNRQYNREDVEALARRAVLHAAPEQALAEATDFGAPILESRISLIEDGRLYYRGYEVGALARTASVESVAALLWTGDSGGAEPLFSQLQDRLSDRYPPLSHLRPIERFAALLPLAGAADPHAWDLRPASFAAAGARILGLLLGSLGQAEGGVARRLTQVWSPEDPRAEPLLSAALILCADHELNVSTFAARCVASAGATAYHVVSAGLAALSGARHGGHTERVEALLREIDGGDAAAVLSSRLRRGEAMPGFGQRLYPDGDPRAKVLINMINESYAKHPALAESEALCRAVLDTLGEHPTIDLALATLGRVLGLPPGGALGLFALGRTIGWIGQAIEQNETGQLIRPRARYVGARLA